MAKIDLGKVVPEKGVDYYTASEKSELKEEIKNEINLNNYYTKDESDVLLNVLNNEIFKKQDALISGTNIKTINSFSMLGQGNIDLSNYKLHNNGDYTFWYSYVGVKNIEDINAEIEGESHNILEILPMFLMSPISEIQYIIGEMSIFLKMFKVPSTSYIDSTVSKYLIVNVLGVGTISLMISESNGEYTFDSVSVHSIGDNVFCYTVDISGETPDLEILYVLSNKQDKLISGENIKTINDQNILGNGNIIIESGNDSQYTWYSTSSISGWYSYMGLNSLDNIYYMDGEEQSDIVDLTYWLLRSRPNTVESDYLVFARDISSINIPQENYIDSEQSAHLIIDMYTPEDGYLGYVNFTIAENESGNGYIVEEATVNSYFRKFEYYIYPDREVLEDSEYRKIFNISDKQNTSARVTSLSADSKDTQYPSAKCVYDLIGDVESLLGGI